MRFAPLTFIKPDELKHLHEHITALESQVTVATDFVKEIEKGNWEAVYDLSSDKNNALQDSLISLRTQLQTYALQEKERNWVTEGLAKFIDILRSKNEDISELTDNIIRNLVKYMGANQGALYLVNDDNLKDTFVEMTACYAYDRKKFMHQRIEIGEGLAGQAILEKDVIYLTEVPKSYMRITSGLGDASPSNLLIVPLKIEEKVFGVVEIASFKKIEKYQIEFVQRLGESIASTLSTVKVNQRTHKLLQETQVQAEQMRSQEEEMRQNMEELSATQEEMQRVLKEVQDKEKYLNDLLSVTSDSIFTVGKDYKVISYNEAFVTALQGVGITNPKGLDMLSLYANDLAEKEKQKSYYDRALKGEKFETTSEYEYEGNKSYYTTSFAPMLDEAGKIVAVASFSKDVTAVTVAQKETERLLKESKAQTEEMRAQEEEIRQNMEELSATQEEMQRILQDVQGKEKYVNELLNVSADSIFTLGKDYKVIHYNQAFAETLKGLGLGFSDPKGFDLMSSYTTEEEKAKNRANYDRAFAGETFELTTDFVHGDMTFYFTTNYAPLRNELGEIVAVANFAKNVTATVAAQKETERLLKESKAQTEEMRAQEEEIRQNMEELAATQEEMQRILQEVQGKEKYLSDLLSVSKDMIFTVDRNYKIVNYNQALLTAIEGIGFKEAKGFDLLAVYPDQAEKAKQKSYYDRAFAGESFEITSEFQYEGVSSHNTTAFAPLRDAEGNIIAVASFAKDVTATVTAQKEIEKALTEVQDKEKFMTDMLNVSKDSIFVIDKDYKISHFNQAMAVGLEAMGIKDLKGFDILSLYPDAVEKKKQQAFYDRAFKGENYEDTNEYTTNGVTSYYTVNYAPLRNSHGKVVAVANFAKDTTAIVSAQKQAEKLLMESKQQSEELRAQEEEIRQNMEELSATQEGMQRVLKDVQEKERYLTGLINASDDSILTVDRHMKVINCNETFRKSYSGYGFEIGKGFDINNLFANEEDKKKYAAYYKRVFKGESFKAEEEYTFGDIQAFYTIQYSPIKDENGDVVAAAVFVHDATQLTSSKKEIEKLLAASTQAMNEIHSKERYLDELINVTNDSIFTVDRDFKIVSFNQSIAKAMEVSGVILQKGTDLLAGLPENEKKREVANYKRAFKGESFEAINEITVGPDQKLYFAITYAPLHDVDGKISVVAVFSKDVTALHNKK